MSVRIAVDASGEIIATSSPRGGRVVYWDAATGRVLGTTPLADAAGSPRWATA